MREALIVGSGPSGVAAALEFVAQGIRPLIVDVGVRPPDPELTLETNLYDHRAEHDCFDMMIGEDFSGASNLRREHPLPVKVIAPGARWVTQDAETLSPLREEGFSAIQSLARGGLANIWGAGLYRFVDRDLIDFPIRAADLDPFADRLTQEIGICGTEDALQPFFGPGEGLLEPLRLSKNAALIEGRYQRKRRERDRIYLGRPRQAVLSREHAGRPAFGYRNTEFFAEDRAIYSPRYTLDRLEAEDSIDIESGWLVERFVETETHVAVHARHVERGEARIFETQQLFVAAGAINSARLVLASAGEFERKLPLLDNPAVQFPLVLPRRLGAELDRHAFGLVQLNLVWDSEEFDHLVQASLMEVTAPMRAEFFSAFPLAARDNVKAMKYLLPAIMVMQLFLASTEPMAQLSLSPEGPLVLKGTGFRFDLSRLNPVVRFLRRLGAITSTGMAIEVRAGQAIHYGGCLPMREKPGPFECDVDGRLHGHRRVRILDAANFPAMPAKNTSFGMMANAMRIVHASLRRENGIEV